jgi:hypothetical protein
VAVGFNAGQVTQGSNAVAVGLYAGQTTQATNAVAVGRVAGYTGQGASAVAVGNSAGYTTQGQNAVALGNNSGLTAQGASSIAVGALAGQTNQHANSTILNATGLALNSDGASRFYVKPVRSLIDPSLPRLSYNATTGEICYGDSTTTAFLPMTLDKVNNRVGINNTTPTTALDVTGTITATNLAGTLTTAAQPNITSVGTLGSLSVSGAASAGTLSLQSISNTSTSNVLYYDTTSKAVSYGAASVLTPTQTKTTTTVSQATGPSDTTLVSLTSLAVGWYHVTASYQWQLNNTGGAAQNTLKTVFKLYKGSSIVANDCDQPGDYTVSYGTMSAVVEIAAGDSVSLTVATPNTPGNAVMDIVTANTFLTVTKIA